MNAFHWLIKSELCQPVQVAFFSNDVTRATRGSGNTWTLPVLVLVVEITPIAKQSVQVVNPALLSGQLVWPDWRSGS